jgi:hypothetical protein
MWTIRQEQTDRFRQYHLQKFEDELVEHSQRFAPTLCKIIGRDQVRVVVRSAMTKALGYRFSNKGPIRLFVEMTFLCGSAFDTDPQYPFVSVELRSNQEQMARAERIHLGYLDYLERVSGPAAANVNYALAQIPSLARVPLPFTAHNFADGLLKEMNRIFPQKVGYLGETRLRALIDEGKFEADRYAFSEIRHTVLIVVLMFAFGHGCTDDPLYPWIAKTLHDEKIVSPSAKADRLERKAMTWLEQVLTRNRKGELV